MEIPSPWNMFSDLRYIEDLLLYCCNRFNFLRKHEYIDERLDRFRIVCIEKDRLKSLRHMFDYKIGCRTGFSKSTSAYWGCPCIELCSVVKRVDCRQRNLTKTLHLLWNHIRSSRLYDAACWKKFCFLLYEMLFIWYERTPSQSRPWNVASSQ